MQDTVDGVGFEYEMQRGFAPTVLFLHGWGGGLASFAGAYGTVCDLGFAAVNFAFPKDMPSDWGIYDYAAHVRAFTEKFDIKAPIIVGHSFGGRVGMILAAQGLCEKLVLVDSAGLKPKFDIKKKIAVARYRYRVKHGKPLDGFGSIDYNNMSKEKRGVFVRVVNTHLDKLMRYIKCPTLIVWGKDDKDTPPYMAKRLKRGIHNSELVYLNGGHYSYIDSDYGFANTLKRFITE